MNEIKKTKKVSYSGPSRPVHWRGAKPVESKIIPGRRVRLRPLRAGEDAADLWEAYQEDTAGEDWKWLPYGPFEYLESFADWLETLKKATDPLFFVIECFRGGRPQALGQAAYLRMDSSQGVIEMGHIHFAPALQRTREATEALYLMMRCALDDWGYRRLEWKCDARNLPSRRAAERLGFTYEGLFRQHMIVKGRNRDTVWYSIIDDEWPLLRQAIENWLDDENFDASGRQRLRLAELRVALQSAPHDQ